MFMGCFVNATRVGGINPYDGAFQRFNNPSMFMGVCRWIIADMKQTDIGTGSSMFMGKKKPSMFMGVLFGC
jgi:hypothetical protein